MVERKIYQHKNLLPHFGSSMQQVKITRTMLSFTNWKVGMV